MRNEPRKIHPPAHGPETKGSLKYFVWFVPAFLPAVIGLLSLHEDSNMNVPPWFLVLNGVCSLTAGFGFWFGLTQKKLPRGLAGLTTGAFLFLVNFVIMAAVILSLFALNLMVAIYQGCCLGHSGL